MSPRKLFALAAVAAIILLPFVAAAKDEAKDMTTKGEIVDLACYLRNNAKGPDHESCAMKCAKAGQPMGLLAKDGTVYLLFADHKDGSAFEKAKDFAGKPVEITGEMAQNGSMKGITVHGVKAASLE